MDRNRPTIEAARFSPCLGSPDELHNFDATGYCRNCGEESWQHYTERQLANGGARTVTIDGVSPEEYFTDPPRTLHVTVTIEAPEVEPAALMMTLRHIIENDDQFSGEFGGVLVGMTAEVMGRPTEIHRTAFRVRP